MSFPVAASEGTWKAISYTPIRSGTARTASTRAPPLLTPTITWPTARESAPAGGTELEAIAGDTGPRPVVYTRMVSPRRAGFWRLTKEPSGRTRTARVTPSDITLPKMPGLAASTLIVVEVAPPPTWTVTGTVPGDTSHGT